MFAAFSCHSFCHECQLLLLVLPFGYGVEHAFQGAIVASQEFFAAGLADDIDRQPIHFRFLIPLFTGVAFQEINSCHVTLP